MTVKELFIKFDSVYISSRLKPNTVRGYRVNINNHILPVLGDFDLSDLSAEHIDELLTQLRYKGLNNTSCKYCLAVLRKALNFAFKRGYVSTNILLFYDFPKPNRYFYTVLDEAQINLLCHYLEDSDIYPCVLLASCYGLRKGEILGLRKSDVVWDEDLQQYIISINRTVLDRHGVREIYSPKNNTSVRKILVSKFHSERLLRYYKLRNIESNGYFCSDNCGNYVTSNKLNYRFKLALDFLKLPDIRFHDLRHSYATMMLKHGVHPKIVSAVLGHSDISTTLDIYSHTDLSMQSSCLAVLDTL